MNDKYLAMHYAAILAAKRGPTERELEEAPQLDNWAAGIEWNNTVFLHGKTVGHPILGDRHIATSQLISINPTGQWARTVSRFYRLGRPRNISAYQLLDMHLATIDGSPSPKTVGEMLHAHAEEVERLGRESRSRAN